MIVLTRPGAKPYMHQTGRRSYAISEASHGFTGSGRGIGVPSHVRTKVFIGRAAVPQDGRDKHWSEDAMNGVAGDCLCDRLADLMEPGGFLTQLSNPLELQ